MYGMAKPLVMLAVLGACVPYPPEGTGGMAERPALTAQPDQGIATPASALPVQERLACLDDRYEMLSARGITARHPALAAMAREARRDALRWATAGLTRDGALAADRYARLIEQIGQGYSKSPGVATC